MAALTALAIGLAVSSAGLQAYGQHKAGQAAKSAGEAEQAASESEANLAEFNASVATLQSKDAIERGGEAESSFRSKVRGLIGQQRAGFAGANVDVSYGSAADVQADSARLGELDALTIRTNAQREAWGYQVQAADLRTRADILRRTGVNQAAAGEMAATNADIGAAGTLVGAGGSLLLQRYGFKNSSTKTQSNYGPLPKEMG